MPGVWHPRHSAPHAGVGAAPARLGLRGEQACPGTVLRRRGPRPRLRGGRTALFNVYGPRQAVGNPLTGIIPLFARKLLDGLSPSVFEDGRESRDFVHVSDVVRACVLAMEKGEADDEIFNVGTGRSLSLLDVAAMMARIVGGKPPTVTRQARVGDVRHCYADISAIKDALGFEPKVSFEDGVRGYLAELADLSAGPLASTRPRPDRACARGAAMIYLRYRLEGTDLPQEACVAIYVLDEVEWVGRQVVAEFSTLLPRSTIVVRTARDPVTPEMVDLAILAFCSRPVGEMALDDNFTEARGAAGIRHARLVSRLLPHVTTALPFYCVDRRCLEVVPVRRWRHWACRQRLLGLTKMSWRAASRVAASLGLGCSRSHPESGCSVYKADRPNNGNHREKRDRAVRLMNTSCFSMLIAGLRHQRQFR